MRLSFRRLAAILGATALLAASCGGGTNAGPGGPSFASVTARDLAVMVLPAAALEGTARGLAIDPQQSGVDDNTKAASETVDPEDDAAGLAALGRRTGYTLGYYDADLSTLRAKRGVFSISTGVDLMAEAGDAKRFLERQLADYVRLAGTEIDRGVRLTRADVSPLAGPGDGASLLHATIEANGITVYATIVAFRLDRVVAAVVLVRADAGDADARVERLARALARRSERVAAGTLAAAPVPLPAGNGGATPSLAAMALSLADLPAGITVASEGYAERPPSGALADYTRRFVPGSVAIGGTRLASLAVEVTLFATDAGAARGLRGATSVLSGPSGAASFAGTFPDTALVEPASVVLHPYAARRVGAESAAFLVSYTASAGAFEGFLVYFRSGRLVGSLVATAKKGKLAAADVIALARAMAARMASPTAA